jgi:phosphatidate cytidylyltransferase
MLKHRLLMSAVLIPATIGLFVWDHHLGPAAPILLFLLLAISARCVWELVTLARVAGFRPSLFLCWFGVWAIIVAGWLPHFRESAWRPWSGEMSEWLSYSCFAMMTVALFVNAVGRYPVANASPIVAEGPRHRLGLNLGTLAIELLIIIYIGLLLFQTTQLRWVGYHEAGTEGYFALGALVIASKMGDIGAYTFGRLIGGPKMTPRLSPGKTWAGGVGHLLTAGLSSVAWLAWFGPQISTNWRHWEEVRALIFGVIVGFAGLIGDLAESLIKRDVGVKDAPALLPGFGGLLDLMDSLLLAGPVAYWTWHLLYQVIPAGSVS